MGRSNWSAGSWRRIAVLSLLPGFAVACVIADGEGRPEASLVEDFKSEGVVWIRAERERYRSRAAPLSAEDRQPLAAYFAEPMLDRARLLVVEGFDNPQFFSLFEAKGEPYPVDLRRANAMALVDTILIARSASDGPARERALFHELVHMVQYQVLGLERYMESYVESWAENGRRYRDIAHEQQAFALTARYTRSSDEIFSVEDEVRARFVVAGGAGD